MTFAIVNTKSLEGHVLTKTNQYVKYEDSVIIVLKTMSGNIFKSDYRDLHICSSK